MERRKVIQQGKGTLTMSLPSKWIRQVGLSAGDELLVESKGMQLIVGPGSGRHTKKPVEIDLSGFSKGLVYVVLENLYIRGDDEFRLHYEKPEIYDAISDAVRDLLGFEIVEHTAKGCVVKELAKGEGEDFDKVLRRIFLLILTIADDGVDAYRKGDTPMFEALQIRDRSVNKLTSFCMRVLNKQGGMILSRAMHLYTLLTLLEHLGDSYSRLYRDVKVMQPKTIALTQGIAQLLREFYNLFYSFDSAAASRMKDKRDNLRTSIDAAVGETRNKSEIIALHHLRRIADLIVDIEKFNMAMQI
jgi:phosphate uptake regulator